MPKINPLRDYSAYTLNFPVFLVPQMAVAKLHTRNKRALYFYCLVTCF